MQTTTTANKAKPSTTQKPNNKTSQSLPPKQKSDLVEIGGLWAREGATSKQEYFTGEVLMNGVKESIVVFRNGFKQHDNMPDWRIYLRPPLEGQVRNTVTSSLKTPIAKTERLSNKIKDCQFNPDAESTDADSNESQENLSDTL